MSLLEKSKGEVSELIFSIEVHHPLLKWRTPLFEMGIFHFIDFKALLLKSRNTAEAQGARQLLSGLYGTETRWSSKFRNPMNASSKWKSISGFGVVDDGRKTNSKNKFEGASASGVPRSVGSIRIASMSHGSWTMENETEWRQWNARFKSGSCWLWVAIVYPNLWRQAWAFPQCWVMRWRWCLHAGIICLERAIGPGRCLCKLGPNDYGSRAPPSTKILYDHKHSSESWCMALKRSISWSYIQVYQVQKKACKDHRSKIPSAPYKVKSAETSEETKM